MLIVSDTTPLISLMKVSQLDLLARLYGEILIPRAVYEEYLEKELNIEYPGGFKHNKHKGLMEALISKVAERYAQ